MELLYSAVKKTCMQVFTFYLEVGLYGNQSSEGNMEHLRNILLVLFLTEILLKSSWQVHKCQIIFFQFFYITMVNFYKLLIIIKSIREKFPRAQAFCEKCFLKIL